MIHHPVILGPKLIVLAVIIVVLIVLHGSLTPEEFRFAIIISAVVFICCSIAIWVVGYKLLSNPNSRLAKATILSHQARVEDGFVASTNEFEALVGACGKAASQLRPSGTAVIEGKRVAVVTSGEFIPTDADIEVVSVRGSKVVVKEWTDQQKGEQA